MKTVLDVLRPQDPDQLARTLSKSLALDSFLNDADVMILHCCVPKNSSEFVVSNSVDSEGELQGEVHVLKKTKGIIPTADITNSVLVTTTLENPLWSLYLSIHNIYAPQLSKGDVNPLDPQIMKLLAYLEKGLRNAIMQNSSKTKVTAACFRIEYRRIKARTVSISFAQGVILIYFLHNSFISADWRKGNRRVHDTHAG